MKHLYSLICFLLLSGTLFACPITTSGSHTNVSCNGGSDGSATVVPDGGTAPYTYSWSPSGGTAATASGLSAGTYTVTITDANGCTATRNFTITQPSLLMATGGFQTNINCNGGSNGSATVFTTGGTPPYTYSWAPSGGTGVTGTGLSAGTYTVTITDSKGCTATRNFTITQPPALTATASKTDVTCHGGANGIATVSASGGTAPYTYAWSPSGGTAATATGLSAGTYTAIVTDSKGCTTTRNIIINEPADVVSGTTVATNVFCGSNGTINLIPSGGTPPYTYDWGGGITSEDRTGLSAGTYTVLITDFNGCTGSVSTTVSASGGGPSGSTVITNVSCFGGTNGAINLTPSGGTGPYTYSWSNGGTTQDKTGLAAGTYTVTITDANGCDAVIISTVTEPAAPVSGITAVTNVACNGGNTGAINLTPTGGTPPYTFNWNSGETSEDRVGLSAGSYWVTITDSKGCLATLNAVITEPLSPISGTTVITNVACNGGSGGAINLTPTGGTGPYTFNWGGGITTEDRIGLSAGTYTVIITDANGCTGTVSATVTQPGALVSGTTVVTNIACNGGNTGAINLTPTGGTPPYTFDWGSGITTEDRTGLTAGTYTVTITDVNGCTGMVTATVVQPTQPISGSTGVFNVSCFGGSNGLINLTPMGGIAPYTYSWADGFTTEDRTGLSAGTYTVMITDSNGCTGTVTVTVAQPAPVSGTALVNNITCYGGYSGSIDLTPAGGTPPYTYNWGGGITTQDRFGLPAGNYMVTITDNIGCSGIVSVTITEPSAIVAGTTTVTNVTCNGGVNGTIDLTPTGGTPPYTYNWGGGITTEDRVGLTAGTYTVAIYDANGCSGTATATITEPTAIIVTASSQTNVSCNGGSNGSATVAVTGGAGGYTYSWSPMGGTSATATGLAAGDYTVTVTDANGCTATQSFTITEPAALVATSSSQTNVSCNGGSNGSATAAVTGGTGTYTYSWSPMGGTSATATGLSAGTYTVTVTDDNGCTATQSFTITEPAALVATGSSQTNVSCNGGSNGSATVTITGGTGGYTYSWLPMGGTGATATGLAAGTYTVTVTDDNGCTATQSFTITETAALVATGSSQTNVSCNGGSNGSATVAVTGGTGAYTYSWSPMGGTGATATGLAAGTYTVTVTDVNGCTATQSFTITEPAALVATASSQTNVSCNGASNGSATVAVTGGIGAYTYSWSPMGGTSATATGLAAGTYTVTVTDVNGCTTTQSFTITEPAAIVATAASQTNISCNGGSNGSATVAVTGGTGAYTYSWSPMGGTSATATGLIAGDYTVTVTDANGCMATQSFTITEPDELVVSATTDNASCAGADGTASVSVTGGTGTFSYLWSPMGGTAATATGLSAGTYTVTITDVNGCIVSETIEIEITHDIVAPVADIINLPAVTNYCAVLASDIPTPTATDNCSGIITGTTSDVLEYYDEGTYTITWSYDDGNGNITTQTQTINVLASPLEMLVFDDTTFVYNANIQTIEVSSLPAGAEVVYSITPVTGTNNGAINAGEYTITAIVTPPAEAFNCETITLSAALTIERAPQTIIFDPISVKNIETDPDFQLGATATSGLPVYYTYTYTTPQPPATVTPQGFVDMLTTGQVIITAHQDGNENYLPAESVSQLLVIETNSMDATIITVGNETYENPSGDIFYLIDCDDSSEYVEVSIVADASVTVTPGHQFTINTLQPGIYTQEVVVISQDGTVINTYTIVVEKRFNFFDIAEQKFDNVLLVNNNPATNGGYKFVAYEWYKNGELISNSQYYSAGTDITNLLDPTADYYVRMTTIGGQVLQTCIGQVELKHNFASRLYPNPAVAGRFITVEADFPQYELEQMQISVYSLTGSMITTVKSSGAVTQVQLPSAIEDATYIVLLETPNIKKTLKVIVKK